MRFQSLLRRTLAKGSESFRSDASAFSARYSWKKLRTHKADGKLGEFVTEALREVSKLNPVLQGVLDVKGEWIEALRRLAYAYRALSHQYPKAFPLLALRRFATEGTYGFLERLFTMAKEQGLDDKSTAR